MENSEGSECEWLCHSSAFSAILLSAGSLLIQGRHRRNRNRHVLLQVLDLTMLLPDFYSRHVPGGETSMASGG